MKPMLPILTFDPPKKTDWLYEVKYDGFRAILTWDQNGIHLTSRNGNSLLKQFPEITNFLLDNEALFHPLLPLCLDGEIVNLINPFKSNFSVVQTRGRLRTEKKVNEQSQHFPCLFMAFDLLLLKGTSCITMPFQERKGKLKNIFLQMGLQIIPQPNCQQFIQYVEAFGDFDELWDKVVLYDGEGIVAKYQYSHWEEGKRTSQWLKFKNWKYVSCFITAYDKSNGYFSLGVYKKEQVPSEIGQVLFGFKPNEKQALQQTIRQNQVREDDRFLYVSPAICLEVKYLELYENQLREPTFDRFRFDLKPEDCTYDLFLSKMQNLPASIEITHPEKPLWKSSHIKKEDYIHYLFDVSSYILPFLNDRLLTVIRYPHGMFGEPFFQKNCPDYAPDFVKTYDSDGIQYILCNNMQTLLWLGNQLAIEFHIPFQTIKNHRPGEIVFDLDPPTIEDFHLAIKAALIIKEVLDQLNLISFVKTSGNKGLQVYIPLQDNVYSYEDTRLFTSFIANYLVSREPESFTIERMKKKRGHRLYVDYVQHSEGKTIIAPYSMRGNMHAGVATPLFWEEVDSNLNVKMFHMQSTLERIKKQMDPFKNYFHTKQIQPFQTVLDFLKSSKKKG